MPIYEYGATNETNSCSLCRRGFERLQGVHDKPLRVCPECGAPVERRFSPAAVGASESNLDDRARNAGFTKLKRLNKGEYEKVY